MNFLTESKIKQNLSYSKHDEYREPQPQEQNSNLLEAQDNLIDLRDSYVQMQTPAYHTDDHTLFSQGYNST